MGRKVKNHRPKKHEKPTRLKKTSKKISKKKLYHVLDNVKHKKKLTSAVSSEKKLNLVKNHNVGIAGEETWQGLGVSPVLIQGLQDCGFSKPTPVQSLAIPATLKGQGDVVGAAETGSGKTLAFGVPILEFIMKQSLGVKKTGEGDAKNSMEKKMKKKKKPTEEVARGADGVIDLNMVFHCTKDGVNGMDESAGPGSAEDGSKTEGSNEELEGELEEDGLPGEADLLGGGKETSSLSDSALVVVRDNIPEEEFLKVLKMEMGPGLAGNRFLGGKEEEDDAQSSRGPVAIVLAPTRELAMQIHSHITAVAKHTGIKCCPVVGGISTCKQERLLAQAPPIVVATVGRLWMFMTDRHPYFTNFSALKFLVLDEADKMVERGHYQDLWNIVEKLNGAQGSKSRRNLVYSATLMVSRRITERRSKKCAVSSQQDIMDKLMKQIGLKDDAAIVDLTRTRVTVESLTEAKVMCDSEDKMVFLYYFLLQFPGRTIIFVNTIKCLQRLRSILELLRLHPLPLHATMQQRQRLKNLDRFNGDPAGLLVASDVAARGLDFHDVDHVIHYQVPMNTELYVHRSGRTARAQREGLSVILVGPEDLRAYQNIRKTLNKDENLKDFPVELTYMSQLRLRVRAAVELQRLSSLGARKKSSKSWLVKAAKELDIVLDEEEEEDQQPSLRTSKAESMRISQLKAELSAELSKRIMPPSVSNVYPTRFQDHHLLSRYSSKKLENDLLPGMATKTALATLKKRRIS